MTKITEAEFVRICEGINEDRISIFKHNPIGSENETVLWMLLSCLTVYLNLTDIDTPCFNGMPDETTYRNAIEFVLQERRVDNFEVREYLDKLTNDN